VCVCVCVVCVCVCVCCEADAPPPPTAVRDQGRRTVAEALPRPWRPCRRGNFSKGRLRVLLRCRRRVVAEWESGLDQVGTCVDKQRRGGSGKRGHRRKGGKRRGRRGLTSEGPDGDLERDMTRIFMIIATFSRTCPRENSNLQGGAHGDGPSIAALVALAMEFYLLPRTYTRTHTHTLGVIPGSERGENASHKCHAQLSRMPVTAH